MFEILVEGRDVRPVEDRRRDIDWCQFDCGAQETSLVGAGPQGCPRVSRRLLGSAGANRGPRSPDLALEVLGARRLTVLDVGLHGRQPLLLVAREQIGHAKGPAILKARSESGDVVEALAEPAPHHGGGGVGGVTGESHSTTGQAIGPVLDDRGGEDERTTDTISSASSHGVGQR